MIVVQNLSKSYSNAVAISDISFEVAAGEHLVLLGTSGCGKTTTLKMINRLIEPGSGTVSVGGQDVRDQRPEILRRRIGYVRQRSSLFPHLSVAENIAVVPQLLKWEPSRTADRTRELLAKLHLPERLADLYPDQLSGGEAQRVNLARALIADPPILLMDEPFSALDTITRASIRQEFKTLDEFRKKTIILVTHDVQEAFELGDRICLMAGGRIMQIGTPAELLFQPATGFVRGFLGEAYVQLAMSVTPIGEIWDLLRAGSSTTTDATPVLSSEGSVSEALALFPDKNDTAQVITIIHEITGERLNVGWRTIVHAYGSHQPAGL